VVRANIILDDGLGTGTALDGNGGTCNSDHREWRHRNPDTTGTMWPLATQGFNATGLMLTPTPYFTPSPGTQLTLINNTATPAASNPITGCFFHLPTRRDLQQSTISSGARYFFMSTTRADDRSNDLVFVGR